MVSTKKWQPALESNQVKIEGSKPPAFPLRQRAICLVVRQGFEP